MKKYFEIISEVPNGKTRFVITYQAYGIQFTTEVDEVDEDCAKAYFNKFYPSTKFIKIEPKKLIK